MEDSPPYPTGPADEPPLTTEAPVAQAHAHHQGIPYETGEPWLARLPEQMRAMTDTILGSKMTVGDVAYAVAVLIDRVENAPGDADHKLHCVPPPPAALPHGLPETARPQTPGLGKP